MGYTKSELIIVPLSLLIMIAITVGLFFLLKEKSQKTKNIPFIAITIILIVGEVVKQIYYIVNGYNTWAIPLHFCSTYFIWFALAEFSKGEFRKKMQNIAFVATIYLLPAFYSSPSAIVGNACENLNLFKNFLDFHSYFFHQFVILYFLLSIAFKRFTPDRKDVKTWLVCMTIYYAVAVIFAYALETNYFNILYSVIPPMELFRVNLGQIPYNILLGAIVIFAGAIFIYIADLIHARKLRRANERQEQFA